MPSFFRNFILQNELWPRWWLPSVDSEINGKFSISSIEDDVRGHTIKEWQKIVNKHLVPYHGALSYDRSSSKQLLGFEKDEDATYFMMIWKRGED